MFSFRPKATIVFDVDYARYVNDGTRAHWIPRGGNPGPKVLKFQYGGRTVFARVVWHPGTRANPFLDRALREVVSGRGWQIVPNVD